MHDMTSKPTIPRSATVNVVLASYPATAAVLNAYGIDICCGGERSIAEAAADASVDPDILCTMLEAHALPFAEQPREESR